MRAQELSFEEIEKGDPEHRLCNRDLAPASSDDRVWNGYSLFSLWMNDAHNASNYTFAAALFIGTGTLMGLTPFAIVIGVLVATATSQQLSVALSLLLGMEFRPILRRFHLSCS